MQLRSHVLALAVGAFAAARASGDATVVYSDDATWIENIAVRPSNGFILAATASSPLLYQVDPASGEHELVHDFSAVGSAIMSIANAGPDSFVVNTMYCDIYQLACTAGTGITWRVDLKPCAGSTASNGTGRVTQLAKGPDARSLLNGAAALDRDTMLMVDQALGGIWAVDVRKGGARLLFTDAAMNDTSGQGNGVNGIRVRGDMLYFNNPSLGSFARMPIEPATGERRGDAEVIATGLSPDDFEIDEETGVAYIVDADKGQLLRLSLTDGTTEPVASDLAGPTTARWKEYGRTLYVATTGGYEQWLSGNPTVPAIVYSVNV